MDSSTISYYDSKGQKIAKRYEPVSSPVAQYFQQAFFPGSRIFEIGVGSGRDIAQLHVSGYDVVGVEPSKTLWVFELIKEIAP